MVETKDVPIQKKIPHVKETRNFSKQSIRHLNNSYWIWSTTPENWKVITTYGIWSCTLPKDKISLKVKAGDQVVVYVNKTNHFKAIFEFRGKWYDAIGKLFDDDLKLDGTLKYKSRIKVKPIKFGTVSVSDLREKITPFIGKSQNGRNQVLQGGAGYPSNNSKPILKKDFKIIIDYMEKNPAVRPATKPIPKHNFYQIKRFESFKKILERKKSIIFYGPPGTGKTYLSNEFSTFFTNNADNVHSVTFHPSYSYEEFIEGMRPKLINNNVVVEIQNGIFKDICDDAKNDPEHNYVLLIDEINRGNISSIFGELITLIEHNKRGVINSILPYSKEEFTVPKNLFIIATMNTSDRSLTRIDYALRRRFSFIELSPDYDLINYNIDKIEIKTLLKTLNEKIIEAGEPEKQIGHSYFMINDKNKQTIDELRMIMIYEILPLLEEYFYDNNEVLRDIFGDIEKFKKSDLNTFKEIIMTLINEG